MADDEDSAPGGRSEGIDHNKAFKPEGQFCLLHNGARHPSGDSRIITPPGVKRELAIRRRSLDAEFWQHAIEKLDHATKTGKISRDLAGHLATILRRGCAGQLPASWVRLEFSEQSSSSAVSPRLEDQRLGAAMYRLIASYFTNKEDSLFDPAPVQTIIDSCGINKRTWNDWSAWLKSNRDFVENELEMLLLEASFLLENLEDLRCALLFKRDAGG
jgi:hypothetical protein